ncbi:MAG: GNAT family N-acetyltransferase [Oscillospiraceae bacterium]|nr:GNAT family N-acetyltransferase [Oscillospiraceae bacterium]
MDIELLRPTAEYAEDIWQFRREFIENSADEDMGGCGHLKECTSAEEWLKQIERLYDPATCPEGWVTADTYIAVRRSDNKIVGIIDLRHNLNTPVLREWGGHIGYSVRPDERRKGYAKEMLRLALENGRRLGLERVMVTCHVGNTASERTILANGGVYERETDNGNGHRIKCFWIEL